MGETTNIEWADHTFNPWIGCTKISPACDHCYAEDWDKRFNGGTHWGASADRHRTSMANWQKVLKWNEAAAAAGKPVFVFCASLADVFDNMVPTRWRDDLWWRIHQTPALTWLLLTKRPQNIAKMLPDPRTGVPEWGEGWPNVWLGTTVENQAVADRNIPVLLSVPAVKRFLSCEPLLGQVDLTRVSLGTSAAGFAPGVVPPGIRKVEFFVDALRGAPQTGIPGIDWVIAGGESGPQARFPEVPWFRALRDQCAAAGVPFMFKQWGEYGQVSGKPGGEQWGVRRLGKKKAGRLLDGVLHDGRPDA